MKFTLFKIPQHRQFHYTPFYYDEAKVERQERERRIKSEMGIEADEAVKPHAFEDRIRGKMNRRIKTHFEVTRQVRRTSTIRLIVILIALFALFYYLLKANQAWYDRFF